MSLDEVIAHRTAHLTAYQNKRLGGALSRRWSIRCGRPATAGGYGEALPRAVAVNYAKLLAYKDEYEVARLYTDGSFEKQMRDQFEGDFKLSFHLAPPLLSGETTRSGRPKKQQFGPWMLPAFKMLANVEVLARHAARSVRLHYGSQARA